MLVILISCQVNDEETQLTVAEGEEAQELTDFVTRYKVTMIDAVNTGNFNDLEPFLITNNSFYHSVRRYVSDLHGEKSSKTLEEFEVEQVYVGEAGEYFVDGTESVTITSSNGSEEHIDRKTRFEIIRPTDSTSFRIETIKERK